MLLVLRVRYWGVWMTLGNIQALQSLLHSAAANAGSVQELLDEAETYFPSLRHASPRTTIPHALAKAWRARRGHHGADRSNITPRGLFPRLGRILRVWFWKWLDLQPHPILEALWLSRAGYIRYLRQLDTLEATLTGAATIIRSTDSRSMVTELSWSGWPTWPPFVALAQLVSSLTGGPVPYSLGVSAFYESKRTRLWLLKPRLAKVKVEGDVELALRLRFGEPGRQVTLAESSQVLQALDNLWSHCANTVRPVDEEQPQEEPDDSAARPAEQGTPSRAAGMEAPSPAPGAGTELLSKDIDTDQAPEPQVPPSLSVRISEGSLVVELLQAGDRWWGVQAMALTSFVIRVGPSLAGLPQRMRERWYENAADADRAKQALQVVRGGLEQGTPLEAAPASAALESGGRPGTS
jgi:hypothetical protein